MTTILAIDPGPNESGWCVIDTDDREPLRFGKTPNWKLMQKIRVGSEDVEADAATIEMVRSYGMAVGAEVFETCVWIGKFSEAIRGNWHPYSEPTLTYRGDVKLHHCHSSRAKDANVIQALVDRFAPGEPNKGKGTKGAPGWFHGFAGDIWQAYALAVYVADLRDPERAP